MKRPIYITRTVLYVLMLFIMIFPVSGCQQQAVYKNVYMQPKEEKSLKRWQEVSPEKALELLKEGNKRYTSLSSYMRFIGDNDRKNVLETGQRPFAVILSCSDSRVPPEIVFDQTLGDLLVVRNLGNIMDSSATATIEYGVEVLKTPLVFVLGHNECEALNDAIEGKSYGESYNFVLNKIKPLIAKIKDKEKKKELLVEENVINSIAEIKKIKIAKKLEDEKKLMITGGVYDMLTGKVNVISEETLREKGISESHSKTTEETNKEKSKTSASEGENKNNSH